MNRSLQDKQIFYVFHFVYIRKEWIILILYYLLILLTILKVLNRDIY